MAGLWAWFLANVFPNLVASAICTAVVWVRVHIHLRRHEQAQRERHQQLVTLVQNGDPRDRG